MVTESPSPDTKVRFDVHTADEPGGTDRTTLRVEAEYAFAPWLSLELDAPYTFLSLPDSPGADHFDNVSLGLKYANYALARHGVLLGGGIEVALPTGSETAGIGSEEGVEIEPFLDAGLRQGRWEVISFVEAGFSTAEEPEADVEAAWRLSVRYAFGPRVAAFFEIDETHAFGGEEDGVDVVNVAPGLKVAPFNDGRLKLGASLRLPLTDEKAFDTQALFSFFFHF